MSEKRGPDFDGFVYPLLSKLDDETSRFLHSLISDAVTLAAQRGHQTYLNPAESQFLLATNAGIAVVAKVLSCWLPKADMSEDARLVVQKFLTILMSDAVVGMSTLNKATTRTRAAEVIDRGAEA